MKTLCAILFLLCVAPLVQAEEPSYFKLVGQYSAVNSVDVLTTEFVLVRGGSEQIPWMKHRGTRLAVKLVLEPMLMAALDKAMKDYPKMRHFVRKFTFGVFLGLGAWNVSVGLRL